MREGNKFSGSLKGTGVRCALYDVGWFGWKELGKNVVGQHKGVSRWTLVDEVNEYTSNRREWGLGIGVLGFGSFCPWNR